MHSAASSNDIQGLTPRAAVEPDTKRPASFLDLPVYPDHDIDIPPLAKSSSIVEVLAGTILGICVAATVGVLSADSLLGVLTCLVVGAVLGAVAGLVVAMLTGPTGVLTWRNLAGAMVRVSLVTLFGVVLGIVGVWFFESDQRESS